MWTDKEKQTLEELDFTVTEDDAHYPEAEGTLWLNKTELQISGEIENEHQEILKRKDGSLEEVLSYFGWEPESE
jgi:hypothetical protein